MRTAFAILAGTLMLASPVANADDGEQLRLARAEIYGHALTSVEPSLAPNSGDPQVRILKSRVLIEQGRSDDAIELLQTLAAERPTTYECEQMLALIYAARGLNVEPRALLQRRLVAILAAARQPHDGTTALRSAR